MLYGMSHLVNHCVASMRGHSRLGGIQFWGLLDNLGLDAHVSRSSKEGGTNASNPPEDMLQALAHTSASDLHIN